MQIDNLHDKILQSVKSEFMEFGKDSELLRYESLWRGHFRSGWKTAKAQELRKALNAAQVVFLGDFHGYEQSQRTHLRLLRSLVSKGRTCLLLESFSSEHDRILEKWLAGQIDDQRLLQKTGWSKNWGFSWEGYRPLLDLAKERGWGLRGLTTLRGSLSLRDRRTAARIQELSKTYDRLIVVVGDFHLGPKALPKILKANAPSLFRRSVWIHQNSDDLRPGRLSKAGMGTHIYHRGSSEYCLVNSAPWVKWMSHLVFSSQGSQRLDPEPFVEAIQTLAEHWSVHAGRSWESMDWSFKTWLDLPSSGRSFYRQTLGSVDPARQIIYLSRPSVNLGCHLVAQALFIGCMESSRAPQLREGFLSVLFLEMLGFCVSKTFNPYRPARTLLDLARESSHSPIAAEAYLFCLKFMKNPGRAPMKARLSSGEFFAARRLGAILGEIWWRSRGSRDRSEKAVLGFFMRKWSPTEQRHLLEDLLRRSIEMPLESKGERL